MTILKTKAPASLLHLGLAGCGKMGTAMVVAWMQSFHITDIDIYDPSGLSAKLPGNGKITGFTAQDDFLSRAAGWDILILSVKPQVMDEVCAAIAPHLHPETCVLSIAAGKTLSYFADKFGRDQPVIRAMPNTPASIAKGMSVACASSSVSDAQKHNANFLLSCLGKVEWIDDEMKLDAVTAVSGSGPAYVFHLIESLAEAGVKSGLDKDLAMTLARQTVIGAAALADAETIPASTLRENVTSPGGTTAAALSVLMDGRLQALMDEAVGKATERSRELSA